MRPLLFASILAALSNASSPQSTTDAGERDEITSLLPDLPPLSDAPFGNTTALKQYSGYLQVSDTHFLHYWFIRALGGVESADTPVVFWFNGGPGCSSLYGLLTENGPFLLADEGKSLKWNRHGWAKFGHVVYIESPAGVGFSYSTDGNVTTDDEQTAVENYAAVKAFLFEKFPSLSKNPVFLTGESYAGVYIPMLAVKILDGKAEAAIDLRGVAIGNGYLHRGYDTGGLLKYCMGHGFISEADYNAVLESCCEKSGQKECDLIDSDKDKCAEKVNAFLSAVYKLELYIYNIFNAFGTNYSAPKSYLYYISGLNSLRRVRRTVTELSLNSAIDSTIPTKAIPTPTTTEEGTTCAPFDGYTSDYLNRDDLQKALNIAHSPSSTGWAFCNDDLLKGHYHVTVEDVSSQMKHIVDFGVRALLYYGDLDMACNFIGGEEFTASLGYEAHGERGPWLHAGQIAGFKQAYANDTLTFITVLGAGHMAPTDKPIQVAYAIEKFLHGEVL